MSQIIPIDDPRDPRLADYTAVRERQLAAEFAEAPCGPGGAGVSATPWGKFISEGELVFRQHVASAFPVVSVLTTPTRLETIGAELAMLPARTPVYVLPQREMDAVAGFPIHRGLLAIGARRPPADMGPVLAAVAAARPIVVMDDVVNNDNTGAMFRNAAAFGAAGILLSQRSADPLYRKALRVSVGHALRLPWARYSDLAELIPVLRRVGVVTLAMTPRPPPATRPLREVAVEVRSQPVALIVGAEGPGLRDLDLTLADERVSLTMAAGVDSLNVATAAAVALYELTSATAVR